MKPAPPVTRMRMASDLPLRDHDFAVEILLPGQPAAAGDHGDPLLVRRLVARPDDFAHRNGGRVVTGVLEDLVDVFATVLHDDHDRVSDSRLGEVLERRGDALVVDMGAEDRIALEHLFRAATDAVPPRV